MFYRFSEFCYKIKQKYSHNKLKNKVIFVMLCFIFSLGLLLAYDGVIQDSTAINSISSENLNITKGYFFNIGTPTTEVKNLNEHNIFGELPADLIPEKYLIDEANLIKEPIRTKILETCYEIDSKLKIRIMIKTEVLENLETYSERVEKFFSEWIRGINLDKRGILMYAALSKNSFEGKFNMRVGIGLRYIITQEIGEKIINQIILPNNLDNNDGKGFLEGLLTLKKVLLDEAQNQIQAKSYKVDRFSIINFLLSSKELLILLIIVMIVFYYAFFIERCPRCNNSVSIEYEILKEPGNLTLGLRRRIYKCSKCGFMRRKKELLYPGGIAGFKMWLLGKNRRNIKIDTSHRTGQSNNKE